jgi:hypothetical protein
MAMPFDTLKLARRLEAAGFAPQSAGDIAAAIGEALPQLATKADLAALARCHQDGYRVARGIEGGHRNAKARHDDPPRQHDGHCGWRYSCQLQTDPLMV